MTQHEYEPVPVADARWIGDARNKEIVAIVAWDEACGKIHVTTWGSSAKHKEWAAQLGPILAKAAGGDVSAAKDFEDFRAPSTAAENASRVDAIRRSIAAEAVEEYIGSLTWTPFADETQKSLVAGNLRVFAEFLRNKMVAPKMEARVATPSRSGE